MPAYKVQKTMEIAAPVDHVQNVLVDYHQWPAWSPWLCAEPDCPLTWHGSAGNIGHGYDWDGKVIGSGQMRLVATKPERIDMDLQFIKPFKSTADIAFNLQAIDSGNTRVEWLMDSSLPFFLFFMTANLKAMIGADYRRGLLQLKDYIETGNAGTKSVVQGVVDVDAISYVGTQGSSSIETIGDILGDKLSALYDAYFAVKRAANADENHADSKPATLPTALTFYNKMDIKRQHCDFTAAIAINELPGTDGVNTKHMVSGHQTTSKALKIVHTGEYRHLGNAWATGMMHMRANKMKPLKSHPPFEKYISDPQTTPGPELITEIYLPVK